MKYSNGTRLGTKFLAYLPLYIAVLCGTHCAVIVKQTLKIRVALEADARSVSELVKDVAHYFLADPSGKGADGFLSNITETAMAGYIASPAFRYIVGLIDCKLAGVAALRDNKHIYHLVVHPTFHRQGVANKLWHRLRSDAVAAGNPGEFTVNSSLYAVPVYSRFGFVTTADQQIKNGIHFQPMQLVTGR